MTTELVPEAALTVLELADGLYDRMIEQQRAKVLRLAREAVPYISSEDVMNPNDFPQLKAHPTFDYEDGILAGLLSAQMALRAELKRRFLPPLPGGA
jgi:hypothetical protein